jgi:hypothetical protein
MFLLTALLAGIAGQPVIRPALPAPTMQTVPAAQAQAHGGSLGTLPASLGGGRRYFTDRGHTPKEWGMSRACFRMVRKNRRRAKHHK